MVNAGASGLVIAVALALALAAAGGLFLSS